MIEVGVYIDQHLYKIMEEVLLCAALCVYLYLLGITLSDSMTYMNVSL